MSTVKELHPNIQRKLARLERDFERWIATAAMQCKGTPEEFTEKIKAEAVVRCIRASALCEQPMFVEVWSVRGDPWVAFRCATEKPVHPLDLSGLLLEERTTI